MRGSGIESNSTLCWTLAGMSSTIIGGLSPQPVISKEHIAEKTMENRIIILR